MESSGSRATVRRGGRPRPSEALQAELVRAQKDYLNIYRELRDASPRVSPRRGPRPPARRARGGPPLRRAGGGLLLDYVVGQGSVSLIVIPPDGPARGLPVVATPDQARRLGIEPGLMTGPKLARAVAKVQGGRTFPAAPGRSGGRRWRDGLAALWTSHPGLGAEGAAGGRLKRLMIAPDGPLALLPFEALVVRSETIPGTCSTSGPRSPMPPRRGS